MDILNEVEERFPVDQWMIDGIHIWPLIRLDLAGVITNYYMFPGFYNKKNNSSLIIKILREMKINLHFVYAYFKDFRNNARAKKSDVVFLSDGISFSYLIDSWYEKFCDPFINKCRSNGVSCLLMTPLNEYFIPRHTPSMFIQPYLDIIRVTNLFVSNNYDFGEGRLTDFENFVHFAEYKNLSKFLPDMKRIKRELTMIKKYEEFYSGILKRSKPQLAFLVSYYNLEGMAFNATCRKLGIPSVDIQHGLQGDLHWAYGRWNNVPETGYELLPKFFWVWNDFEAEAIKKWSCALSQWHKPIVGGNLFLDLWKSSEEDEIGEYYDKQIEKAKRGREHLIHILYTVGYEEVEKLEIIFEVVRRTESLCYWWLRVHPGKLKERTFFKKLVRENRILNGEVDLATDLPLYALLRQMDLHLTFYSSSVFEAKDLGVPSVVVGDYAKELFSDHISSGWALPADTPEEIISGIKAQFHKRDEFKKARAERDEARAGEKADVIGFMREAGIAV